MFLSLQAFPEHQRTGPLALKLLLDDQLKLTNKSRSLLKQAWYHSLDVTDYPGANIVKFCSDWLLMENFLRKNGEDVSESRRQFIEALLRCPNKSFRLYIQTLDTMNDAKLIDVATIRATAIERFREQVADGTWNTRSKAEHSAFQNKKKQKERQKANKASTPSAPSSDDAKLPAEAKSNNTKKTHDAQGNAIDRTPPKSGSPQTRTSSSGKEEKWCGHERCGRWGNHLTGEHDA